MSYGFFLFQCKAYVRKVSLAVSFCHLVIKRCHVYCYDLAKMAVGNLSGLAFDGVTCISKIHANMIRSICRNDIRYKRESWLWVQIP